MRTLLDFLMEENDKDKKDNKKELPGGFVVISNQGSLTEEAKQAIGAKSFKKGMEVLAAQEGGKSVREKLKAPSGVVGGTPREILKGVMNTKNDLDEVFKQQVQVISDFPDGVIVEYIVDLNTLAGSTSSSKRLLKLWLQSTLVAYNCPKAMKRTFALNEDRDLILIF